MNAVYVRSEVARGEVEAALLEMFPSAKTDSSRGWIIADDPDLPDRATEAKLLRLSRDLGAEVFWITYQTVVDAFQYHHWQRGKHIRSLVYGCYQDERTWERVEGVAESWERQVLFSPEKLESTLSWYENPRDRTRLESIWRDQVLVPGEDEPDLIAEEVAGRVIESLGLG